MINADAVHGRTKKSESAFRTISEVATELGVQQHVLRFWETRFNEVQPLKRGGGRRYYRPEDIALIRAIRDHLYDDGFTIKGVQKLIEDKGVEAFVARTIDPKIEVPVASQVEDILEPSLPFDLPNTDKDSEARIAGLTSHQKLEIQAAIHELQFLKSSLDQMLE